MDGTVSRIDPRTNTVTTKVPVGAPQALAAGAGSAWVSVAAGTKDGNLPAAACSEVASGGGKPDVLIASDLPLQGPNGAGPRQLVDAIRAVLQSHGFRAGKYVVGYQSCDDSTTQTGYYEQRKCAANANAYARAKRVVAVIGAYESFCARPEIPILNRAPGGPLALVGLASEFAGLTRGGRLSIPGFGLRGEPNVYYPTGVRNFLRLVARDDQQGVAEAELAKQLEAAERIPALRPRGLGCRHLDGSVSAGGLEARGPGRGLRPLRRERQQLPCARGQGRARRSRRCSDRRPGAPRRGQAAEGAARAPRPAGHDHGTRRIHADP